MLTACWYVPQLAHSGRFGIDGTRRANLASATNRFIPALSMESLNFLPIAAMNDMACAPARRHNL